MNENATLLALLKTKRAGSTTYDQVRAAAAALGRSGGLIGGQRRAAVLTDEQRRAIAVHAANCRWGRQSNYTPVRSSIPPENDNHES